MLLPGRAAAAAAVTAAGAAAGGGRGAAVVLAVVPYLRGASCVCRGKDEQVKRHISGLPACSHCKADRHHLAAQGLVPQKCVLTPTCLRDRHRLLSRASSWLLVSRLLLSCRLRLHWPQDRQRQRLEINSRLRRAASRSRPSLCALHLGLCHSPCSVCQLASQARRLSRLGLAVSSLCLLRRCCLAADGRLARSLHSEQIRLLLVTCRLLVNCSSMLAKHRANKSMPLPPTCWVGTATAAAAISSFFFCLSSSIRRAFSSLSRFSASSRSFLHRQRQTAAKLVGYLLRTSGIWQLTAHNSTAGHSKLRRHAAVLRPAIHPAAYVCCPPTCAALPPAPS